MTQLYMSNGCYIIRSKNYVFRPVVAIIRFLSLDSPKIILYNSRCGVFDEEISTSKPLLEHITSILGVCQLNHVIIHKSINLYYQKQKTKTGNMNTPNIEVIRSNKGFDLEISPSNTPPRELYRIILSESHDKT